MAFRGNGQGTERRRRVLIEDSSAPNPAAPGKPNLARGAGAASSKRGKRSGNPAVAERQPRITDLIPARGWLVSLLTFGWLAAIAGVASLHWLFVVRGTTAGLADTTVFDATQSGSLASWLASLLLLLGAGYCLVVYSLRRHNSQDYRGQYRLWFWAAACLLLFSLDATTHLHRLLPALGVRWTGSRLIGDGAAWAFLPYVLALFTVGGRAATEMGVSRTAAFVLILALGSYLASACATLGVTLSQPPEVLAFIASTATLLGHLGLLLAVQLYARHVHLDALGLLRRRKKKARRPVAKPGKTSDVKASEPTDAENDDEAAEQESPPPPPPTTAGLHGVTRSPIRSVKDEDDTDEDDTDEDDTDEDDAEEDEDPAVNRGPVARTPVLTLGQSPAKSQPARVEPPQDTLSRAERKRLKKLQRRE